MAVQESTSVHFLLCPAAVGHERREEGLELLTAGRRSAPHVLRWAELGQVYVLWDPAAPAGGGVAAAALTMPVGAGDTVELRLLEAAPAWRDEDVDLRLVEELADALRAVGVRRIMTGVGDLDVRRMHLLTRAGFRMSYVERDACTPERGWGARDGDGPDDRDLLWLDLDL